jgi:hypothetical protein
MIFHAKSQPAPECLASEKLKANGNYNCEGVLNRLKEDFRNKCYLCEDKEPHSINTEHFKPHRGDIDLKFAWDNLFYCCAHCNNTKLAKNKYDDILNCTVVDDQVDKKIKYHINPWPKERAEITAIEEGDRISNTVDLLDQIYNGTTELKKIESANIRTKLLKEIRNFQNLLFEYYDDNYNDDEREKIKSAIVRQLRPTSNFTAFKLWVIRDNEELANEFGEYI